MQWNDWERNSFKIYHRTYALDTDIGPNDDCKYSPFGSVEGFTYCMGALRRSKPPTIDKLHNATVFVFQIPRFFGWKIPTKSFLGSNLVFLQSPLQSPSILNLAMYGSYMMDFSECRYLCKTLFGRSMESEFICI